MQTVLIGITSGIAAYKVISLVKSLRKKGYRVIVIMTEHAKKMLSEKDFEHASGSKIASELFPKGFNYRKVLKNRKVAHISLADSASVICIAPATANIIAKLANGISDDLLTTTVLASKATLLLCPSMNVNMWNNKTTRNNIARLKQIGFFIIPPEKGMLACGYEGVGRLADIFRIENEIIKLLDNRKELAGKKVIVTAGGTEEDIDPVRVITNRSSGKMGIYLAEECVKRGAELTLIRARTDIEPNVLIKDIKVKKADEMSNELRKIIKENNIVIHAAAVSDFKVKKNYSSKISSEKPHSIKLVPNVKILDDMKKWNRNIFLVGFKADTKNLIDKSYRLLKRSSADMIVANDIRKVFGSDYNKVIIVKKKGPVRRINRAKKEVIAEKIVDEICKSLKE